jgi:hypothetical protein
MAHQSRRAAEGYKENGSRRYIRALLPLLAVRSTVKRGPKQEQRYASQPEMDCDKPAQRTCNTKLKCVQNICPSLGPTVYIIDP